VRSVRVEVLHILAQYDVEVAWPDDQEVVEAFPSEGADEPFRDRIRAGCPDRGANDPHVSTGEDGVEGHRELAVPVADQEPEPVGSIAEIHQQVACLLGHPGPGGVGGYPADMHPAAVVLDNNENVEAAQEDRIDVGEVDREDRVGLRRQELPP
jgi:hypothetical protein